jgi:alginate O-acetyltransferase complex protein AlgI
LPAPLQVALTYVLVLFSWVFFRAADLPAALAYCAAMLGLAAPEAQAWLIRGIIYQPYYLVFLVLAAAVTWCCPQTWDWSRRLTAPKIVIALLLLLISLVLLTTQAFNPFIYFIF